MSNSEKDDDAQQIDALMQVYIEGARNGSSDHMRPIFHEMATISGYVGPDLFAGPIAVFYAWHADNGPAVDIEGTAAGRS